MSEEPQPRGKRRARWILFLVALVVLACCIPLIHPFWKAACAGQEINDLGQIGEAA
jgi:hypothetical protein